MQRVSPRFDPATLAETVGKACFARGAKYALDGAVVHVEWDGADSALRGTVRGSSANFYTTTAYFSPADELTAEFAHGACSCPVGFNCKHAVALVLAAAVGTGRAEPPGSPPPGLPGSLPPGNPPPVAWERSLESLLGPGPGGPGRAPRPARARRRWPSS